AGGVAPDAGITFGELLRRYRTAAGLTQEELAARAGLTPQGISLLERGERRHPQAYTVRQLAAVLGLREEDRVRFAAAALEQRASACRQSYSYARTCAAAPGWCACSQNWRRDRSSRCRPGHCRPSRSGG